MHTLHPIIVLLLYAVILSLYGAIFYGGFWLIREFLRMRRDVTEIKKMLLHVRAAQVSTQE